MFYMRRCHFYMHTSSRSGCSIHAYFRDHISRSFFCCWRADPSGFYTFLDGYGEEWWVFWNSTLVWARGVQVPENDLTKDFREARQTGLLQNADGGTWECGEIASTGGTRRFIICTASHDMNGSNTSARVWIEIGIDHRGGVHEAFLQGREAGWSRPIRCCADSIGFDARARSGHTTRRDVEDIIGRTCRRVLTEGGVDCAQDGTWAKHSTCRSSCISYPWLLSERRSRLSRCAGSSAEEVLRPKVGKQQDSGVRKGSSGGEQEIEDLQISAFFLDA